MNYTEISKILIEHHKAYKKAVKLTEKEEELLNDYAADLDMDIEGAFEKTENKNAE